MIASRSFQTHAISATLPSVPTDDICSPGTTNTPQHFGFGDRRIYETRHAHALRAICLMMNGGVGSLDSPIVRPARACKLRHEPFDAARAVTIEAVLKLSAQQVAGEPSQGKPRNGDIRWHGTQKGTIYLRDRKLPVNHGFDERAEARARRFRFQRMWRCRIGRGWELVCSAAVIVSRGKGTGAADRQAV